VKNKELNLAGRGFRKISQIKGLEKLDNLEKLVLSNNEITKIEGLENLTSLKYLYLNDDDFVPFSRAVFPSVKFERLKDWIH